MRRISTAELLQIWEYGQDRDVLHKSLLLLTTSCPPADWNTVVQWPVGTRDGLLIQFREQFFGDRTVNNAVCPACSETLEWEMKTSDLLSQKPVEWVDIPVFSAIFEAFSLQFRLPNSADFLGDIPDKPFQLIRNCIISAQKKGKGCDVDTLPENILQLIESRMETEDPNANLIFNLNCPTCSYRWQVVFDILTYLWKELDAWARQRLQEVFILARAFGWSEHDILSMNAKRRQFYLEMIGL